MYWCWAHLQLAFVSNNLLCVMQSAGFVGFLAIFWAVDGFVGGLDVVN
jgi:hypothetical protein